MNFPTAAQLPWITAVTLVILVLETGLLLILMAVPRKERKSRAVADNPGDLKAQLEKLQQHVSHLEMAQNRFHQDLTQSLEKLKPRESESSRRSFSASGLDKKHYVLSLAEKGLGTEDISRRLNIYPGEAELVLGLTKLQKVTNPPRS